MKSQNGVTPVEQTWETIEKFLVPVTQDWPSRGLPMPSVADLDALATFANVWLANAGHRKLLDAWFFGSPNTLWRHDETTRAVSLLKKELPKLVHAMAMPPGFENLTAQRIKTISEALLCIDAVAIVLDEVKPRNAALKTKRWHASALGLARNLCGAFRNAKAPGHLSLSGRAPIPRTVFSILEAFPELDMKMATVEAVGMHLHRHRAVILSAERHPCDHI